MNPIISTRIVLRLGVRMAATHTHTHAVIRKRSKPLRSPHSPIHTHSESEEEIVGLCAYCTHRDMLFFMLRVGVSLPECANQSLWLVAACVIHECIFRVITGNIYAISQAFAVCGGAGRAGSHQHTAHVSLYRICMCSICDDMTEDTQQSTRNRTGVLDKVHPLDIEPRFHTCTLPPLTRRLAQC